MKMYWIEEMEIAPEIRPYIGEQYVGIPSRLCMRETPSLRTKIIWANYVYTVAEIYYRAMSPEHYQEAREQVDCEYASVAGVTLRVQLSGLN
jgi:hypothetical protein